MSITNNADVEVDTNYDTLLIINRTDEAPEPYWTSVVDYGLKR